PYLERRELDDDVFAGEDALEVPLEIIRSDRGKEADAPKVDADDRHVAAEELRERTEHRAVAPERDDDLGVPWVIDDRDPNPLGDRTHPLDGLVDVDAPMRDDRGGANRPRPLQRSARR